MAMAPKSGVYCYVPCPYSDTVCVYALYTTAHQWHRVLRSNVVSLCAVQVDYLQYLSLFNDLSSIPKPYKLGRPYRWVLYIQAGCSSPPRCPDNSIGVAVVFIYAVWCSRVS